VTNLKALLARLIAEKVEFVVVGGVAAVARGSCRATFDLDVAVRLSQENLSRLHAAVADLHPRHRMHPDRPPWDLQPDDASRFRNIYLTTDLGTLDCLGDVAGLGEYTAVLDWSDDIESGSGVVRMLTLDGLIRAKQVLTQPKDREHLAELKAIRERLRENPPDTD
jgi:hypothetical protein